MREKSPNQILRFDGKNVFVEIMNNAFEIGKVQLNFIEYDATAEKKSRIKKKLEIFIDIDKFLLLTQDILSGRMLKLFQQAIEAQKKGGFKYAKEIYTDLGGINAETLKRRGKERPDGKSLSRQFKITPGMKVDYPWVLSGEYGPGQVDDNGLIVPQGRPEETVRVPLSDNDFKKMAITVQSHIQGFIHSQYESKEVQELKSQLETMKPIMNGLTEFLRKQNIPVVFPKKEKE